MDRISEKNKSLRTEILFLTDIFSEKNKDFKNKNLILRQKLSLNQY